MIRELLSPPAVLMLYGLCAAVYMLRQYQRMRRHRRLTGMLLGNGSGIAGLLLLHFFGGAWGMALPLTLFHFGVSAVGGLPGVLLLIAMHLLGI
ncbi:MAG: pro-sigmaK processing inhibitor BofA family protein [Oscillospiraceae bacterium]|nr:pro-sigmaK processing inhibitor BofA family protein [Oscillospiraceae bacterium]